MASLTPLEALATSAVNGDAAALSELCRRLETPVFRLCLRVLGDPRDAEDATQDVLVKVLTNLSSFEGRSALTTWVHRIAVRHVLSRAPSRTETRAVPLDDFAALLDQGLAWAETAPAPGPDDRLLEKEVRLSCTQGMLMALGREDRVALVLVEVLGFDAPDAAQVLEVSPEAMRQRLSRARTKLEAFVGERCGVVSQTARCRCVKQIPAKQALGLTAEQRRFEPLTEAREAHLPEQVARATAELRLVGRLFHADGPVFAPKAVRERLERLLPTVLGR